MTDEVVTPQSQQEIPVAEVMQQIRAGIRQRQAELAAWGERAPSEEQEQLNQRYRELQAKARIQERPFVSHVPLLGRFIALFRETWNSVAAKWYVRPMLRQQNVFNQTVAQMLQELFAAQADLRRRLDETNRYLEQIEERVIRSDQDLSLIARKTAEGEYRIRRWERQTTAEQAALDRRLAELENVDDAGNAR